MEVERVVVDDWLLLLLLEEVECDDFTLLTGLEGSPSLDFSSLIFVSCLVAVKEMRGKEAVCWQKDG